MAFLGRYAGQPADVVLSMPQALVYDIYRETVKLVNDEEKSTSDLRRIMGGRKRRGR